MGQPEGQHIKEPDASSDKVILKKVFSSHMPVPHTFRCKENVNFSRLLQVQLPFKIAKYVIKGKRDINRSKQDRSFLYWNLKSPETKTMQKGQIKMFFSNKQNSVALF